MIDDLDSVFRTIGDEIEFLLEYALYHIQNASCVQMFQCAIVAIFFCIMLYQVFCPVPDDPERNKPPTLAQKHFGSKQELAQFCKDNGMDILQGQTRIKYPGLPKIVGGARTNVVGEASFKSKHSSSTGSMGTECVDNSSSSSTGSNPIDLDSAKGGIRKRSTAMNSYSTRASDVSENVSERQSAANIVDIETLLVDLGEGIGEDGGKGAGKGNNTTSFGKKGKKAKRKKNKKGGQQVVEDTFQEMNLVPKLSMAIETVQEERSSQVAGSVANSVDIAQKIMDFSKVSQGSYTPRSVPISVDASVIDTAVDVFQNLKESSLAEEQEEVIEKERTNEEAACQTDLP